jgi:hypothetical protein
VELPSYFINAFNWSKHSSVFRGEDVIKNDQEGPDLFLQHMHKNTRYVRMQTVCNGSDFACCFYVRRRLHLYNLRLLCDITPMSFHSTSLWYLNVPAFGGVIGTFLALSSNFGPLMQTVDDRPADLVLSCCAAMMEVFFVR